MNDIPMIMMYDNDMVCLPEDLRDNDNAAEFSMCLAYDT